LLSRQRVKTLKFCSECGAPAITLRQPVGDHRLRQVCDRCGAIHYENPRIVAGCIPEWQGHILLCRRSIEPRAGYWTLPAGFMENGESTVQAAAREAWEEANAVVEPLSLFAMYSLPHISQVYLLFRGQLRAGQASAGAETLEVRLFDEAAIPWRELAFPVISETLERYFQERRCGNYSLHLGDISRAADGSVTIHRY
jgi:ADP-ribose pyrophosphatase YjhB (NUDIX family)